VDTNKHIKPPRNYFSRREQLRLLMLVMSLGLVVLLIGEARDPRNWYWLTGEQEQPARPARSASDDNYDTSYQPTPVDTAPADTIRILPAFDPMQDDANRFFPGVRVSYLSDIKDNSPFIERRRAWFNLLEVLGNNDSELINQASTGDVTFVQLYEQPEVYRGHLVTVRGEVKRAQWIAYGENAIGLKGIYRFVLRTKGGPNRPLVLFARNKPEGFPLGEYVSDEQIEVTGFFYKVWNYPSEIGPLLAPVMLARDFTWYPAPVTEGYIPSPPVLIGLGVGAALIAALFAVAIYRRSQYLFIGSRHAALRDPPSEAISRLQDVEPGPSMAEQLRELSSRQQ